jgi:hypothetical protein
VPTLADIRTRLRTDLDDSTSAIWSDADLDRHLSRALRELSAKLPQQKKTTLVTTPGSRDLSLTTLTDRVEIEAVEYPTLNYPQTFVRFSVWVTTLTLLIDGTPATENVFVYWTAQHVLDGSGTTLPSAEEELLALGAGGFALLQQAASGVNTLNTGGANVDRDYRSQGLDALREFRKRLNERRGIRRRELYEPAEPLPSQSTDPGP